jgi:hypothetical protein
VRAPDGVALRDGSGTDPRLFLVPYPVVRRRLRLDASPGDQPLRPHALFDPVLLWCATILPAAKQALADIHPDAARRGRRADHHGLSAFPLQAPTAWCAADNPPPSSSLRQTYPSCISDDRPQRYPDISCVHVVLALLLSLRLDLPMHRPYTERATTSSSGSTRRTRSAPRPKVSPRRHRPDSRRRSSAKSEHDR